jgi:hypothetical protein
MADTIRFHDISQRENHFESEIFNVFPLEEANFVQSSPPIKKQRFDAANEPMILSTQNLESAVIALRSRENELGSLSPR